MDGSETRGRYNHLNCQSLFGYALQVHERSGGVCELCFAGSTEPISFDFWRQLTVEHLIGASQGGYLKAISETLRRLFPNLPAEDLATLARRLDIANTITACSFCNSTTSRNKTDKSMEQILTEATGSPDEVVDFVSRQLDVVLAQKRADVRWKLDSVRQAFESEVVPRLEETRRARPKVES
jgi:hypothetical protein